MEMSKPYARDIQHACHVKKVGKYIKKSNDYVNVKINDLYVSLYQNNILYLFDLF